MQMGETQTVPHLLRQKKRTVHSQILSADGSLKNGYIDPWQLHRTSMFQGNVSSNTEQTTAEVRPFMPYLKASKVANLEGLPISQQVPAPLPFREPWLSERLQVMRASLLLKEQVLPGFLLTWQPYCLERLNWVHPDLFQQDKILWHIWGWGQWGIVTSFYSQVKNKKWVIVPSKCPLKKSGSHWDLKW